MRYFVIPAFILPFPVGSILLCTISLRSFFILDIMFAMGIYFGLVSIIGFLCLCLAKGRKWHDIVEVFVFSAVCAAGIFDLPFGVSSAILAFIVLGIKSLVFYFKTHQSKQLWKLLFLSLEAVSILGIDFAVAAWASC